jgi:hypothetical protein
VSRNTARHALHSGVPPRYQRASTGSAVNAAEAPDSRAVPDAEIPLGFGQHDKLCVVVGVAGFSRLAAG